MNDPSWWDTAGTVCAGILMVVAYMALIVSLRSLARFWVNRQERRQR